MYYNYYYYYYNIIIKVIINVGFLYQKTKKVLV